MFYTTSVMRVLKKLVQTGGAELPIQLTFTIQTPFLWCWMMVFAVVIKLPLVTREILWKSLIKLMRQLAWL